jgi:hypothetical protein
MQVTGAVAAAMLRDLLNTIQAMREGLVSEKYLYGIYDYWLDKVKKMYEDLAASGDLDPDMDSDADPEWLKNAPKKAQGAN